MKVDTQILKGLVEAKFDFKGKSNAKSSKNVNFKKAVSDVEKLYKTLEKDKSDKARNDVFNAIIDLFNICSETGCFIKDGDRGFESYAVPNIDGKGVLRVYKDEKDLGKTKINFLELESGWAGADEYQRAIESLYLRNKNHYPVFKTIYTAVLNDLEEIDFFNNPNDCIYYDEDIEPFTSLHTTQLPVFTFSSVDKS